MTKKKFVIFLAFLFIVLAFPSGLLLREMYNLSDQLGIALSSFILGIGVGLLGSSIFISSYKDCPKQLFSEKDDIKNLSNTQSDAVNHINENTDI